MNVRHDAVRDVLWLNRHRLARTLEEGYENVAGEVCRALDALPAAAERPASVVCSRCESVFMSDGGRISIERFPGDAKAPEVGTNGLCESCFLDAVGRLAVFLFGPGGTG